MKLNLFMVVFVTALIADYVRGDTVIVDVSSNADVAAVTPTTMFDGFVGRGGFTAADTTAADGEDAIAITGSSDGTLFSGATFGDILIPGSGFTGFDVPDSVLGQDFVISYDVLLPSALGLSPDTPPFFSFSTRFLADVDDNQFIGFGGADPDEFGPSVFEFSSAGPPDVSITDAFQTVTGGGIIPTVDSAGQAIGQLQLNFNIGEGFTIDDANPILIRNIRVEAIAAVPEPSSLALLGLGGVFALARRRR